MISPSCTSNAVQLYFRHVVWNFQAHSCHSGRENTREQKEKDGEKNSNKKVTNTK